MKEINIEIPDGYEIDKENSTFNCIKFKVIKNKLPNTFKELNKIFGYYINDEDDVISIKEYGLPVNVEGSKCNYPTRELAEAAIALAQLLQLKHKYNNGWIPDFNDLATKYSISQYRHKIETYSSRFDNKILSFKTKELRDLFMKNFKNLLETAKPLI